MNNDHVSQPTALRLKEAGWEWETEFGYVYDEPKGVGPTWDLIHRSHPDSSCSSWLPAPNISEIRERLTKVNLRDYWFAVIRLGRIGGNRTLHEAEYSEWLYTVTASADLLAEVWIWTTSNKKGE